MRLDERFHVTGFAAWLACAAPTFVDIQAGRLTGYPAVIWAAAFVTFGTAYALYLRSGPPAASRLPVLLLVTQTIAGLTMVWTAVGMTKYLAGVSLMVVVGELPYIFSSRVAWIWVAVQSAVLALMFRMFFGWLGALSGGGAFAGFQVFALGNAMLQRRERAAREELARMNAELRATRELLAEDSRTSERLRISRDLHDSLGHHLTALSIQLDVAGRQIDGPAADHVREAHAIARLLLADVRNVVSELRNGGRVDLAATLRPLASNDGKPNVHLDMPSTVWVDDSSQAHALFRCVQEIVTNAARHGGAANVFVQIAGDTAGVHVVARDDGRGATQWSAGHGLTGMRERFEEFGGRVDFATEAGRGFEVRGFMPYRGVPT